MIDPLDLLERLNIASRFGAAPAARGRDYAARGLVRNLVVSESPTGNVFELSAQILGTRSVPYHARISLTPRPFGVMVEGHCTCPVAVDCKHVVAVLYYAQEGLAENAAETKWERQLLSLLEVLEEPAATDAEPLALLIGAQRAGVGAGAALDVFARPLVQNQKGRWVQGITWRDITVGPGRTFEAEQLAALEHLAGAARGDYYGIGERLSFVNAPSGLWPALEHVRRSGIAVLPGKGLSAVTVVEGPQRLAADATSHNDQAKVSFGVRLAGQWYPVQELQFLGAQGHGVAVVREDELLIARLNRPAGRRLVEFATQGGELVVPGAATTTLASEYLPRLKRQIVVESSDASLALPELPKPELILSVDFKRATEAEIAWFFGYRTPGDETRYPIDASHGFLGVRDRTAEREAIAALELTAEQEYRLAETGTGSAGLKAKQTFYREQVVGFVDDVYPLLQLLADKGRLRIEERGQRPDFRESFAPVEITFTSAGAGSNPVGAGHQRTTSDWLDLDVVVAVEGQAIALAELIAALTQNLDRMVLPGGLHFSLDRPEFKQLRDLIAAAAELHDVDGNTLRLNRHDLGLWEELAELGVVDAQASDWVRAARALTTFENLPRVEPVGLHAELRSYQQQGLDWLMYLWNAGLGGVLADDMGLGKTLQTLAMVNQAKQSAAVSAPFLVLTPTSVISTWVSEAKRFTPDLRVVAVTESRSRRAVSLRTLTEQADVVVTSYTLLRMETDGYADVEWAGVVLDEAHTVKNHQSKTYQAVRRLDATFKLALTGTPLENRLVELWSLLSIVAPGLYPYPKRFVESVAKPVEQGGDTDVLARFQRRIKPFMLRRTKELVASDLPSKQETVLAVPLGPKHEQIYQTHLQRERQNLLGLLADAEKNRIAIFGALTKLRQLSLDPALVDPEHDGVGSAKLDLLVDHLKELAAEGHRALVFSQFTSYLRRVQARLDAEGIPTSYLDGATRRRSEVIDAFRSNDDVAFLISLKAGGVGLTLTEADYVFILDPWWNPAAENQAVDRTHRIGQQRPVNVYRLVSQGTIEEKVMELKARKAALFDQVIEGTASGQPSLSADDLADLLRGE